MRYKRAMPLDAFRNAFAGAGLDRAGERRADAVWIAAQLAAPESRLVPLWNGAPLVVDDEAGTRLSFVSPEIFAADAGADERRLFLGLDSGRPLFAIDLDTAEAPAIDPLAARGRFVSLRTVVPRLSPAEASIAATAKAIFEWRRRHRRCSVCGAATNVVDAGWKRRCPACAAEHFPRTDPVVIMLPVRGERCLLGRQARFPVGMHSALAGFVEPGESLEEACARELKEEAALDTLRVTYHSSQPWPFPHSLMIGLIADVGDAPARADEVELEAVRWFTRDEARRLVNGETLDGCTVPPPEAIAHQLIRAWSES